MLSTMIDRLKKEVLKRGVKLLSNPSFMRTIADPRVMRAISQAFAVRGRIQSEADAVLRSAARFFNVATVEDIRDLKRTLRQMESAVSRLERRIGETSR
jgi:TolA-binding protein